MRLTIDFETRSACDIKRHGAWVYSEHPTTEVLCMAWKFEDDEVCCNAADRITAHGINAMLELATEIEAHNAQFEYAIWQNVCVPRYGWPPLPLEKLRCSAAKAAMHSLPRSLDGACQALGLPVQKDAEGYRLMLKMCRPRPRREGELPGISWHDNPKDLERLYQYCMNDVLAEECLSNALRDLPEQEQRLWQLDLLINARGIQADLDACRSMLDMVEEHEHRLLKRLGVLTMGAVKTAKQVDQLRNYLRGLGVDLPDLAAATVKEALKREDLSDVARELLEIRRSLGRSSSAKYQAIIDRASGDGRVRGALLYHGAGTGRWCLAEGTLVLVKDPFDIVYEKPIEKVTVFDRVWDGHEWVNHDGVVFSGIKEVVEYDSVLATDAHKVYISDTEYITLGEAKRRGLPLYSNPPESRQA